MADRSTLAIHKLDEFKQWLDLVGVEHRPTTADWQVIQVRLPNDPRWHAVYRKMAAKEHLSVPGPLTRLVRAFVNGTDPYEALGQATGMSRDEAKRVSFRARYTSPAPNLMQVPRQAMKALAYSFRYGNPTPTGRIVQPHQPPLHQLQVQAEAAKQMRTSMNRCCEKAVPLGVAVCPECAETSAGYQGCMGPVDDSTPPWG